MPDQLQIAVDSIKHISQTTHEPAWFAQIRTDALAHAQNGPLPRWDKRTPISRFPWQLPSTSGQAASTRAEVATVSAAALADGVLVSELFAALHTHEELLQRYFASSINPLADAVTALHYAALASGTLIYIPKGVQVAEPIIIKQRQVAAQHLHSHHVLIVADRASQVHVVAPLVEDADDSLLLHTVEVFALEAATVHFTCTQDINSHSYHVATRRATVERDAQVEWVLASLGAKASRDHTDTILKGAGSQVRNLAVLVSTTDQHNDVGISIDHQGEHTSSDIMAKSIGDDTARVIYRANTHISHAARFATAYQKGNTLLLSKSARADAIPALTIDVDEVQAGHAATIGQVDEIQLFYLMSRGLTRQEAVRLVAMGFIDPILQRLPSEDLRTHLFNTIDRKMV